ncbi:MAG TPA: hypothetical protein VFM86_12590, partial [Pedococcus sp.]|nr:hypothetical protein [Pedococcus sp.]
MAAVGVGAQALADRGRVVETEDLAAELPVLLVERLDLGQAEVVDLLRRQGRRRVVRQERGVRGGPVGEVHEADVL